MSHKKEKSISLLLAGLVLLEACSAPGAETPTPSPAPEVRPAPVSTATPTPEPMPTPEPTPEPTEEPKELWGFPIDDTHDAFEVPTGGRLGTVLVTVEIGEEGEHQFSVWTKDDLDTPLQTMTGEGTRVATWHDIADVDFDGYMDFGYVRGTTAHTLLFNYWLWNEEQGQFVWEPQLAEIAEPQFDQSTKTIFERYFTWNYSNDSICKWQGTELICVRQITVSRVYDEKGTWLNQYEWTVKALVGNELAEIHRETVAVSEDSFFAVDNIEDKWYDLDYFGE